MYAFGSSAWVGVGKHGHGGRKYRPPPKQSLDSAPPPLKECDCLILCLIPEYERPEHPSRRHLSFGGREGVEKCERILRSKYNVHLIIPGRKQFGAVAIAAKTYRQGIPAVTWLLEQLYQCTQPSETIPGRIQLDVKNTNQTAIVGQWQVLNLASAGEHSVEPDSKKNVPFFVFHGHNGNDLSTSQWSVLACHLASIPTATQTEELNSLGVNDYESQSTDITLQRLKICVDNASFLFGSAVFNKLDIFTEGSPNDKVATVFALGNRQQGEILYQEVLKCVV